MKYNIKIGVVCLVRNTFDYVEAQNIFNKTKQDLKKIKNVEYVIVEETITEPHQAREVGSLFAKNEVDGITVISGTFHLGHLALEIASKNKNTPILLWGYNELPYDGGKIRLNSVCGVNLNASNFYKAGIDTYTAIVGDEIDTDWIDAVRMTAVLKNSHIGLCGYRAHGFFNLDVEDLSLYKKFGMLIDHYELGDMFSQKPDEKAVKKRVESVRKTFKCEGISDEQVEKVSYLVESIKAFLDINKLDAVAVRCWPEYAQAYGISPCAAMAILQDEGRILGCEGDIEGTISMLCLKAIGGKVPFLADLSQVNLDKNFALMWHCGVAAPSLCSSKCDCSLDTYFAGGKGVTTDFVMKSGRVQFFRIDTARGEQRIFDIAGKSEEVEKQIKGTYAKVVFDKNIKEVMDSVINNGVAHHLAMCYGDYEKVIKHFERISQIRRI